MMNSMPGIELPERKWWAIGLVSALITVFVFVTGVQSLQDIFSARQALTVRSAVPNRTLGTLMVRGFGPMMGRWVYAVGKTGERELLFKVREPVQFLEADVSPDHKKIAVLFDGWSYDNYLIVANLDGSNKHQFKIENSSTDHDAKNLVWVDNQSLRLYMDKSPGVEAERFRIDNWPLREPGTFELAVDDLNTLREVRRLY